MTKNPDAWQVIRVDAPEGPIYKVFATWYGSYLSGSSWQLNSGICAVRIKEKTIEFDGYSGSTYVVPNHEHCYRTDAYTGSVLAGIIEKAEYEVQILPFDTDWSKIVE